MSLKNTIISFSYVLQSSHYQTIIISFQELWRVQLRLDEEKEVPLEEKKKQFYHRGGVDNIAC